MSLCQLPFVLTPEAKAKIMQGEALLQKQHQMQALTIQVSFNTEFPIGVTFGLYHDGHLRCGYQGLHCTSNNDTRMGAHLPVIPYIMDGLHHAFGIEGQKPVQALSWTVLANPNRASSRLNAGF